MKSILFPNKQTASKSHTIALLLGFCIVATFPVRGAELPADRPLTLADCVTAALGQSPALEAYKYDLKAADAAIWMQRAALLPQLTGSAQMFVLNGEPVSPFSVLGVTEFDLITRHVSWDAGWIGSIGVTYPLFENGSIFGVNEAPAVASAKAQRKQQEWTRNLAEEDAIYTVAEAYFNTLSARRKVALYERMVE
jgi:outer membrane protein TolC